MKQDHLSLELDKILSLLAAETNCEAAAEMARELTPATDLPTVAHLLDETDAAYQLMARYGSPSFGGLGNTVNAIRRAQAGAVLSLRELLEVLQTLRAIRALNEWRAHCEGVETVLDDRFSVLIPNRHLEDAIDSVVINEEEVSDNASPALFDIRRKIRAAASRVRDQLDRMIRSQTTQKYLQEPIVTQRDGRFVVPVRAEFRGSIPGLVHDTSASGATVFVEPMAVVEANNEIRLLEGREKEEIERILAALSARIGEFADGLVADYHVAVELNLIFAKARLGYKMKAGRPEMGEDGHIDLHKARHPLIDPKKVVAVDVELGGAFDTLVITGPNTGGKTVTLKTLGLLTLMAECGLLIPAADGSRLSTFDRVLADIGDEQSIEQSLSTFSAHMVNLIRILKHTDDRTLVLVDELGAGTDPVEGAALAVAILERLRDLGARVAATTHYAELKAYALSTPGVENGSCEFDVATLRPTYRLLVGVPGRSNAFAISRRLGMDPAVVDRADELVAGDDRQLEEVMAELDAKRQELERRLAETEALRAEATAAAVAAREQTARLQEGYDKEMARARQEAERLVSRARAETDALLRELEEARKHKNDAAAAAAARSALKRQLDALEGTADPVKKPVIDGEYTLPRPLKTGDTVLLADIGREATVLSVNGDRVEVQAGAAKMRVELSMVRLVEAPQQKKQPPRRTQSGTTSRAERDVHTELDIRGMSSDEGIMMLDRFIDNARMSGLERIYIIHGKGTGVLRAAVQRFLKTHPAVKSFRLGTYGEGEMGVTVAELK